MAASATPIVCRHRHSAAVSLQVVHLDLAGGSDDILPVTLVIGSMPNGSKRDSNAWGLYDVQGNVWEMTSVRADEPIGQVRGGSFAGTAGSARFGNRSNLPIAMGHPNVGLRLVINP